MRPHQWYKNLVIFLSILFGGVLFDWNSFLQIVLGFISLCGVSSFNYIINDIVDRKRDMIHPEKRNRPIAAGKIKVGEASVVAGILFIISMAIAAALDRFFFLSVIGLAIFTLAYTFYFKKELFADIILIALNFVIRSVSGAFIVDIEISYWLILCPFFLSLFLSVGKRESDIMFLGKKAQAHREILGCYSSSLTHALMIITTTSLIMSYSLYSFLSVYKNLIITLPLVMYAIFRYLYLIYRGSDISRHPERIIKDKRLVYSGITWVLCVIILIYLI